MLCHVKLFETPWTAASQASLSNTNSRSPHKPMSIELMMPYNHLILCRPLLVLPSIFLSIRVFSNESALRIRWPKYWSFSFSISPSSEYSVKFPLGLTGLISLKSSSVQSLSCVWLFVTPWTTAHQVSLSITNSQSLLKLMSIELVMPSNHLIFCCPLLLPPSIFPRIRVFSSESALRIRWPKYRSFSFSTSSSNEYSGLISFRMDRLDLLAIICDKCLSRETL